MSTARIAPVAMVLQRRASATLPPASFCAMMPEPTTAARRNAVPSHSANRRRASVGINGFRGLGRRAFHLPDLAELALQAERVDGPQWQRGKDGNALVEHAIGFLECERGLGGCALPFRWIRNAPMSGSRMSGPHGACFRR